MPTSHKFNGDFSHLNWI